MTTDDGDSSTTPLLLDDSSPLAYARFLFSAGLVQKAADLGLPAAQAEIAERKLLGTMGDEADARGAVRYARRAAGE